MPRFKGFTPDPEASINASYFVDISGTQALTVMSYKRQPNFLPPIPLPDVATFMVDDKAYNKATRGKLVMADISLECEQHNDSDHYCRELDRNFKKVAYLIPKILNPKNLQHFLPNGVIISTPVFNDFLPDRELKVPINLIEILDNVDINVSVINPLMTNTPLDDFQGVQPQPPSPFEIYRDPPAPTDTPSDSAPTSPASTMSLSTSDASSIFEASHIQTSKGMMMVLRPRDRPQGTSFEPLSTSTKSPEKKDPVYDDPTPGTSSDMQSSSYPPTQKPKTPRMSPRKELKRTASQPAIDEFILNPRPRLNLLPSPIPRDLPRSSSKRQRSPVSPQEQSANKYKRILSDLSTEEREVTRSLEDSLMRDNPAIKEATVNPNMVRELGSPTSGLTSRPSSAATNRSMSSDGSSLQLAPNIQAEINMDAGNSSRDPPPMICEDVAASLEALPPSETRDARQSSDKSPPQCQEVPVSAEDARNTLSDLPLPTPEPQSQDANSSEEMPPPSQGTSYRTETI